MPHDPDPGLTFYNNDCSKDVAAAFESSPRPDCSARPVNPLKELMDRYDEYREKWVARFGSPIGYDDWFRRKIVGEPTPVKL
jgi:hypothetical protein